MKVKINWWQLAAEILRIVVAALAGAGGAATML